VNHDRVAASLARSLTDRVVLHLQPADLPCPCSLRELPAGRVQQIYGIDNVRMADLLLLRRDLGQAAVVRDLAVTIETGPLAGAGWYVLDPQVADQVCIVVRLRRSQQVSTTATSAKVLR